MDHRRRGALRRELYASLFDEDTMTIAVDYGAEEGYALPAVYKVCPTCDGKGKHINPDVDENGLTSDDFADDPDFAEQYMSDRYDVQCYECFGKRVVPRVDRDDIGLNGTEQAINALEEWRKYLDEWDRSIRERESERRYGA